MSARGLAWPEASADPFLRQSCGVSRSLGIGSSLWHRPEKGFRAEHAFTRNEKGTTEAAPEASREI